MRVIAVFAVALLLSDCTWVRQELEPTSAPPVAVPSPKPDAKPPHRPQAERPPVAPVALPAPAPAVAPAAAPPIDYSARCHVMARNRADDARQLGAPAADQMKIESDTYRDCMAQSK